MNPNAPNGKRWASSLQRMVRPRDVVCLASINLIVLAYLNLFCGDALKLHLVFWLMPINAYPLGFYLRDKFYKPIYGQLLGRFLGNILNKWFN
jgi:hypothetical protein